MNNIDIRAEWAKIKSEETRVNKLLVDYLFPVTEDMVRREANDIFESEIDRIMDKDTLPWYEARQQAITELDKQLDDYVKEAISNLQPDPDSQEFRQALFSRIVNKRLDDETKKEIKQVIVDTLKKVKKTQSLERADISQGKLATSLTLKIEGILAAKYKEETDGSLREHIKDGLYELDIDLNELLALESDAGLGNGGLGRLAACFMDSLASLNYPGHGNTIRYKYGFFRQKLLNGKQIEIPDNWLQLDYPFEIKKAKHAVTVKFYGNVVTRPFGNDGRFVFELENAECVKAVPYDVPIIGDNNQVVNTLRLWSAEPSAEIEKHTKYGVAINVFIISTESEYT